MYDSVCLKEKSMVRAFTIRLTNAENAPFFVSSPATLSTNE